MARRRISRKLVECRDRHRKTTAEQKQGGGGVTSLTCTEGVDVLVELEPHHGPIVVDDVGLTVPSTRHHLLSAVPLEEDTNTDAHGCCIAERIHEGKHTFLN